MLSSQERLVDMVSFVLQLANSTHRSSRKEMPKVSHGEEYEVENHRKGIDSPPNLNKESNSSQDV